MQEEVIVEALLDSETTGLVISSEFTRKQGFKLKKIENPIYVRNVNEMFNKKGLIKNTVEVNIYYQGHRERMEINVIGGQKQNVILEIPQLICHNPEINWKIGKVKMTRCLEECEKQQRLKQGKAEWQKKKEERSREEVREETEEERKQNRSKKGSRRIEDLG